LGPAETGWNGLCLAWGSPGLSQPPRCQHLGTDTQRSFEETNCTETPITTLNIVLDVTQS